MHFLIAGKDPGCAVDIPGLCYSFSFEPCSDFTQMFPPQQEILNYLSTVVTKYRVDQHFTGQVEWIDSTWQEKTQRWIVTLQCLKTKQLFTQECQVLISAVGGLVNPSEFKAPGVEHFQGEIIHTARWNHNVDLTNKNVAVIGNGGTVFPRCLPRLPFDSILTENTASAAQLIPAIIGKTKSVTQFMRSSHHLVEAKNHMISREWRDWFHQFPFLLYLIRMFLFLYMEIMWFRFQNTRLGKFGRDSVERKSRESQRPRRVFDRGYLATLHESNMHLTDDPIMKITTNSIITKSGQEVPVDVILLANGFSLTQYDTEIRGRQGKTREQHWKEYGHKAAFKTIAMHGFPNFFYILGPNSGRLYTSTIQIIESEVDMVIKVIGPIMLRRAASAEVKSSSEQQYDAKLHRAIDNTVHNSGCGSYFIDKGSEKNWFVYPWNTLYLWYSMHWSASDRDWIYRC
ncbi:hypothetical protein N7520_010977 [Penicillium odoratum]|uniref:uncharacterized protein n=1 Tax=Penicillium odoratum TaxID=1167516 RepID=UPI0025491E52|nr:uncharacterized protein N7520_010977 [Penicillium odoratum]KAJ5745795.1 hypothetical protein N7520_010977 [Penicillium odoratum]